MTLQSTLLSRQVGKVVRLEKEMLYDHDAIVLQAGVNRYKELTKFKEKDISSIVIQSYVRGMEARTPIREMRRAIYGPSATTINGLMRGKNIRNQYGAVNVQAEFLQQLIANALERQQTRNQIYEVDTTSAEVLQGLVSGRQTRQHYAAVEHTAEQVQRAVRGHEGRKEVSPPSA